MRIVLYKSYWKSVDYYEKCTVDGKSTKSFFKVAEILMKGTFAGRMRGVSLEILANRASVSVQSWMKNADIVDVNVDNRGVGNVTSDGFCCRSQPSSDTPLLMALEGLDFFPNLSESKRRLNKAIVPNAWHWSKQGKNFKPAVSHAFTALWNLPLAQLG